MLQHFEKHLYIPSFPVNADNLLVGKVNLCGNDCQPCAFMAVPNEHDFDFLFSFGFHHDTGKDLGLARFFPQLVEKRCPRVNHLPWYR